MCTERDDGEAVVPNGLGRKETDHSRRAVTAPLDINCPQCTCPKSRCACVLINKRLTHGAGILFILLIVDRKEEDGASLVISRRLLLFALAGITE